MTSLQLLRQRWPVLLAAIILLVILNPTPVPRPLVDRLRQAQTAIENEHHASALALLEDILQLEPDLGSLQLIAAQLALMQGEPSRALAQLDLARMQGGEQSTIACLRGEAAYAEGDFHKALALWEESPDFCPPWIEEHIAHASLELGEEEKAQQALQALIEMVPSNAAARYQLAFLVATHTPFEALPLLRQADEATPQVEPLAAALEKVIEAASAEDEPALVLTQVGGVFFSHGAWKMASLALQNAIALSPNAAQAQSYLGLAIDRLGGDGLSQLEAAVKIAPADALPHAFLGLHWLDQGQLIAAIRELQIAAALEPSNPAFAAQLGAAYTATGDMISAKQAYQRATELAPDEIEFLLLLAQFSTDKEIEIKSLAIPAARAALLLQPSSAAALDALGYAYYLMGNIPLAERFLCRSVAQDPMRSRTQYHVGLLRLAQGDHGAAQAALRLAQSLDPLGPIGDLASRSLENLLQ
jgi:tetratricopeptide (TPR) repeat protein